MEDYELEEFFEDTMNNDFNTILDDNSASQLSKVLVNYNHLFRSGKLNEISEDLNKRFPSKKPATVSSSIKQTNDDEDVIFSNLNLDPKKNLNKFSFLKKSTSDEEDEDDENNNRDNCEDMNMDEDGEKRNKNEMNEEDKNNFDMLEEGWTFVAKSGKHFTK